MIWPDRYRFHARGIEHIGARALPPHARAARRQVPPERLLVHKLGDGWGPLCADLGVPEPEVPYPSSNSSESFQAEFSHLIK